MQLDLSKLGSKELKDLSVAVRTERDRRGKRNPAKHDTPTWVIPKKAVHGGNGAATEPD